VKPYVIGVCCDEERESDQPMHLMIAARLFYIPAMLMYFFVLASLHYGYRIGEHRLTGSLA
jgi:hypothetical protein